MGECRAEAEAGCNILLFRSTQPSSVQFVTFDLIELFA